MKRKELKERIKKSETESEKKELYEQFWEENARVRFTIYSIIFLIVFVIL